MSDPYLRVIELVKKFGSFVALRDISLDIYEGEFVCFLGPSGCGKTTLLRAIAGLDIQTHGTIEQAGKDISTLPPSERDFGIVFQSYALFPNLTIAKNIAYGLENRKLGRDQIAQRVTELLQLVGLPDQGGKHPAQLSGGQQQRVALARAIATSPGLLLLDEPLSALDAKVRGRLRHEIKELQRTLGVTTIMVTHDQEEALTMADRIVVMNHGVIDQIGTPIEIYRHPATTFVADFIGTMNFLSAEVEDEARVKSGSITLACDTHGLEKSSAVTLALRPEDVLIQGVTEDQENAIRVTVREHEFLGSFIRAELAIPGPADQSILAEVSINRLRQQDVSVGAELFVALPAEHLRIFPRENGHD